jgi:hypothetical protein
VKAPALSELYVAYDAEDPAALSAANERARRIFRESGCFIASGLIASNELDPIRRDIGRLISIKLEQLQLPKDEPDGRGRFDDGFLILSRTNRAHAGVIYEACRRLMPVHQLAVNSKLVRLSKMLMETETVIACTLNAVRIDHPHEDKYLFPWHQDYPYIQDSEDGVVYWIPLQDMNERNGALLVAVGSNAFGVRPIRILDPQNKNRNGARTIELADQSIVDNFPQISVPMRTGDVLVFSALLLHRSQPNLSEHARWTVQVRHGNFEHPRAVSRDWPGGMIEGRGFEESHPEYVVSGEALR